MANPNTIIQSTSICTRCGKIRIVSKTWTEKVETYNDFALVTHTLRVCPDKSCQKLVDEELEKQRQNREDLKRESELRKRINAHHR